MTTPALADLMHEPAFIVGEPGDLRETVARVTTTAKALVPGVDHASVSFRHRGGGLETVGATDPVTIEADLVQRELSEGPCFDEPSDEILTYAGDLARDVRWPTYGPKAAALGLHSQLAARLSGAGESHIGLNLYAVRSGALDGSLEVARALACLAQVALTHSRDLESLVAALQTREVISKAVGIMMERYDLSDERAFSHLVRRSQTSNVKLREIAREIVATRTVAIKTTATGRRSS